MSSHAPEPLWTGKPRKAPFVLTSVRSFVMGALALMGLIWIMTWLQGSSWPAAIKVVLDILSFPLFAIAILMLVPLFICARSWRLTRYCVTPERIVIEYGIQKARVREILLADLDRVEIRRGLLNGLFGTGTIRFVTGEGGRYDVFHAIDRPSEVLDLIQRLRDGKRPRRTPPN